MGVSPYLSWEYESWIPRMGSDEVVGGGSRESFSIGYVAVRELRLKLRAADAEFEGTPSNGGPMGSRSVQELPVPILTDDELIGEYGRTFVRAGAQRPHNGFAPRSDDVTIRRNSAVMGELLRRGYTSDVPVWLKTAAS
jgi:hypothetical protein